MSTGLYYPPAKEAPTEEVIELAKPMRAYGGIHTTHMRDEASHLIQSVNETIAIGKAADVPVVISHHKTVGIKNHGRSVETLKLIGERMRSQPLGLDCYPYIADDVDSKARKDQLCKSWLDDIEEEDRRLAHEAEMARKQVKLPGIE